MSFAGALAQFVQNAVPDATSAEAQAIMRLSLYDWMVCGIAGATEPVAQILRSLPYAEGDCAVFGAPDRLAAPASAWVNGTASHALDYDDTHFDHIGHPSVAVCPAAFALARSGQDLLWAALIGAEVSVRVGLWLGRAHYQVGYHQTATAGAFGAAAAAGWLLGVSTAQLEAAFGVVSTQAAGLKAQFGTMGKPYHAGLAARTGVEAALLAQAGFDTRGAGVDGPQGFGATHHGENNAAAALQQLGRDWRMTQVSHKVHACCHGLHAMLEALEGADAEGVDAVTVFTHPRWLAVCNIAEPATGLECKFSFRHTAAMALAGVPTARLGSYSDAAAQDAGLAGWRARVRVETDAALAETASRVELHRRAGTETRAHDLAEPLGFEARRDRLRRKGRALLGGERETALWQATHGGPAPDIAALATLMPG